MSFDESSVAQVYQYKPDNELTSLTMDSTMVEMNKSSLAGSIEPAGKAAGGLVPTSDGDTVSLNAPGASSTSGFGGSFSGAVGGVISAATADDGGAAASGIMGSMLNYAQSFFDVSTDDVVKRLRLAVVPYPLPNPDSSQNDFRTRPDFWGPFWVATTAIFFFAAIGYFSRFPEGTDETKFKADYALVSWAAIMIYR